MNTHLSETEFLKSNDIVVGDSVKILSDLTYSGIIMPRYEHSDDKHIVKRIAKLHLTFEQIHPFVDGNGRIGRTLNNFLLINKCIMYF